MPEKIALIVPKSALMTAATMTSINNAVAVLQGDENVNDFRLYGPQLVLKGFEAHWKVAVKIGACKEVGTHYEAYQPSEVISHCCTILNWADMVIFVQTTGSFSDPLYATMAALLRKIDEEGRIHSNEPSEVFALSLAPPDYVLEQYVSQFHLLYHDEVYYESKHFLGSPL